MQSNTRHSLRPLLEERAFLWRTRVQDRAAGTLRRVFHDERRRRAGAGVSGVPKASLQSFRDEGEALECVIKESIWPHRVAIGTQSLPIFS